MTEPQGAGRAKIWPMVAGVVILVGVLLGLIVWQAISLGNEKDNRRAGEIELFRSGCNRVNELVEGARDAVDDGLTNAGLLVNGEPTTPEVKTYRDSQYERFAIKDCSKIPKILGD